MFGFGQSSKEKAIIKLLEPMFIEHGLPPADAEQYAAAILRQVKRDAPPGFDLYMKDRGTKFVRDQNYMAPRLEAGLTNNDVETFWNRPVVAVLSEIKARDTINAMALNKALQQGEDITSFARRYRRTTVFFGEPADWDSSAPFNKGFSECDAGIYVEFANRVKSWQMKTPDSEINRLVSEYGTLNALIRQLVSKGLL